MQIDLGNIRTTDDQTHSEPSRRRRSRVVHTAPTYVERRVLPITDLKVFATGRPLDSERNCPSPVCGKQRTGDVEVLGVHAKVNEPKRHHINPQVLLREFADGSSQVRVVPKYGGAPRLQHISKTSVRGYANAMQTDTGRDNSLERLLSQIEGRFPEAVRLLDAPFRTPEEDALVLSLVATQAARDPWTRRGFFGGEVKPIYEALGHALRDHDPDITEADLNAEIEHYGRTHIVKPHLSATLKNIAVAGTAWLITRMYEDLAPYRLTVIYSPRSAFITADSPVSIYPESVPDRDEAMFRPDTEFVLPITPRHAALITDNHAVAQRVHADLAVEAVINARTAKTALCEVHCTPGYSDSALAEHFSGWWASMPLLRILS